MDRLNPELLKLLKPETLRALQQHLEEKQADEQVVVSDKYEAGVSEDFGLSQFWYNQHTSQHLALEALTLGGIADEESKKRVGFISTPSAFRAALNTVTKKNLTNVELYLFEFDRRFERAFPKHFVFFDFNKPLEIPQDLAGTFDFLIADPPYLRPDCHLPMLQTMRFLAKSKDTRLAFCTGATMTGVLYEQGFLPVHFEPQHSSGLANQFRLFTSYESDHSGGQWEAADVEKDSYYIEYLERKKDGQQPAEGVAGASDKDSKTSKQ